MRSLPMLLLAGALATTACASAAPLPSSSLVRHLTAPRQVVRVTNHSWDNIELSAVRGGTRRVLGVVAAAQDATLLLTDDMLDSDGRLQLAARIQGQREVRLMDPMRVPEGDYVHWSLENDFTRWSVAVYPL
jgi:hypothetical protein